MFASSKRSETFFIERPKKEEDKRVKRLQEENTSIAFKITSIYKIKDVNTSKKVSRGLQKAVDSLVTENAAES